MKIKYANSYPISNIANINFSLLSTNVSVEQKINLPDFIEKGVNVYVKRDDLIHPFISGNKWRKLKYNYLNFKTSGCKGIVTLGGAFSNHILATAAFCAEQGVESIGIIRGEEPDGLNHILILARLWGMKLYFISRANYKNKEEYTRIWEDKGYFVIPEGGDNPDGIRGCEEIVSELANTYDHIFCAMGTGCTLTGIARAVTKNNASVFCHGVAVLKEGDFLRTKLESDIPEAKKLTIHLDYHFGGYAKTTTELLQFINYFAEKTGVLADPVYTGKMFFAIRDLINKGYFKSGESILAIHTGGLLGLLSDKMLADVQKTVFKKKPSS